MVEESEPDHERSLFHHLEVVKYAQPPTRKNLAISNHAQLIVSWDLGPDGVHVAENVEAELKSEPDLSLPPTDTVDEPVWIPKNLNDATPNHAQLIASCHNGDHGQDVPQLAVEEDKPDPELSQLPQDSEENHAKKPKKYTFATHNNALLTVLSALGPNGHLAPSHVKVDHVNEPERLSLIAFMEEQLALILLKSKLATLKLAQ